MEKIKIDINDHYFSQMKTAHLKLNVEKNYNALNRELYQQITNAVEYIVARGDIGALVLGSELTDAFSSGVDVKYIRSLSNEEAGQFFRDLSILFEILANLPIPTIAIVNGYTYGAGADLALSCDLRIATATSVFRFPGPQFGLILGTERLINEIGAARARYLTLLNKKVNAFVASEFGLVHEVCEDLKEGNEIVKKWLESLLNVPNNTLQTLKELTGAQQSDTAHRLTRESVLHGDFGGRFYEYVKK